jgi:hypothetical protein
MTNTSRKHDSDNDFSRTMHWTSIQKTLLHKIPSTIN